MNKLYVIYDTHPFCSILAAYPYGIYDAVIREGIHVYWGDPEKLPSLSAPSCVYDLTQALEAAGFIDLVKMVEGERLIAVRNPEGIKTITVDLPNLWLENQKLKEEVEQLKARQVHYFGGFDPGSDNVE